MKEYETQGFHVKEYKCILVGNRNVGKTTFLNKVSNGSFINSYHPTIGVNYNNIYFQNNYEIVLFIIWEISIENKLQFEKCCIGTDCAIIMNDVCNGIEFKKWNKKIRTLCGDIPIIMCVNQFENRKIYSEKRKYTRMYCLPMVKISNKNSTNIMNPIYKLVELLKK